MTAPPQRYQTINKLVVGHLKHPPIVAHEQCNSRVYRAYRIIDFNCDPFIYRRAYSCWATTFCEDKNQERCGNHQRQIYLQPHGDIFGSGECALGR